MTELVRELAMVLESVALMLTTHVRAGVYRQDVKRCDVFAEACHEAAETLRRAMQRAASIR